MVEFERRIPEEVANAMVTVQKERAEFRENYRLTEMREKFLSSTREAGIELSDGDWIKLGSAFQEYVDTNINDIADAYDYM